jgi:hypothetical protein
MAAMATIEAQPAPVRRIIVSRIKDELRYRRGLRHVGPLSRLSAGRSTLLEEMGERDFGVADIIGLKRRPLDGATAQLDLLFGPETAPLRADRRWSGA